MTSRPCRQVESAQQLCETPVYSKYVTNTHLYYNCCTYLYANHLYANNLNEWRQQPNRTSRISGWNWFQPEINIRLLSIPRPTRSQLHCTSVLQFYWTTFFHNIWFMQRRLNQQLIIRHTIKAKYVSIKWYYFLHSNNITRFRVNTTCTVSLCCKWDHIIVDIGTKMWIFLKLFGKFRLFRNTCFRLNENPTNRLQNVEPV